MVYGTEPKTDGLDHKQAILERKQNDFHKEFTTLRFESLGQAKRLGNTWSGRSWIRISRVH